MRVFRYQVNIDRDDYLVYQVEEQRQMRLTNVIVRGEVGCVKQPDIRDLFHHPLDVWKATKGEKWAAVQYIRAHAADILSGKDGEAKLITFAVTSYLEARLEVSYRGLSITFIIDGVRTHFNICSENDDYNIAIELDSSSITIEELDSNFGRNRRLSIDRRRPTVIRVDECMLLPHPQ